jgi:hypothetical protein
MNAYRGASAADGSLEGSQTCFSENVDLNQYLPGLTFGPQSQSGRKKQ